MHHQDYEIIAPPHSYIHVEDFQSAKNLADYLKYLSRNRTAYIEYFWWTKYYEVRSTPKACNTCEYLNKVKNRIIKPRRLKNFNQYWFDEADCNNPNTNIRGLDLWSNDSYRSLQYYESKVLYETVVSSLIANSPSLL